MVRQLAGDQARLYLVCMAWLTRRNSKEIRISSDFFPPSRMSHQSGPMLMERQLRALARRNGNVALAILNGLFLSSSSPRLERFCHARDGD